MTSRRPARNCSAGRTGVRCEQLVGTTAYRQKDEGSRGGSRAIEDSGAGSPGANRYAGQLHSLKGSGPLQGRGLLGRRNQLRKKCSGKKSISLTACTTEGPRVRRGWGPRLPPGGGPNSARGDAPAERRGLGATRSLSTGSPPVDVRLTRVSMRRIVAAPSLSDAIRRP